MKKVLITGGAGFIGGHLVDVYLKNSYQVVVVDKQPLSRKITNTNFQFYQQDITKTGIEQIIKQFHPNIINHHSAEIHVPQSFHNPIFYNQQNVLATIRLLELGKKYQIKQFIFASSTAVYGKVNQFPITENFTTKPTSFYGLDKLMAEKYIQLYAKYFTTTIFRYANVYGPRQTSSAEGGVVAIFAQNIINNKPVTIYGNGKQTRDFVYVKDVAQANLLASNKNIAGLMQIATNQEISVNYLYQIMQNLYNKNLQPRYLPPREGDVMRNVMTNHTAKQTLAWQVKYDIQKGLKETLESFKVYETSDNLTSI